MVLPLSIPSPNYEWQVFNLGQWLRDIGLTGFGFNININAYAVCILVGIIAALLLTGSRFKQRHADPGVVLDVALFAVVFGIIGARIVQVITHPNDYFGTAAKMVKIFYIWEGGLVIFGGLLFGAVGAYIGCRRAGVRFWSLADALAPALLLAQAFGRLGNWFNHELFGLPTSLPFGLQIESSNAAFPVGLPSSTLFLPTFLYEIVWNFVGIAVILLLERKFQLQWGKVLGIYLIWYGVGQSYFESVRIDPSLIFLGVRTNVWAAFAAIIIGIAIMIIQSRRHPGLEPSVYRPGRERVAPAAVDSEQTYSEIDESGDGAGLSSTSVAVTVNARKPATSGAGKK